MSFWTAAVVIMAIWACVQIFSRRHDRELGVTRDEDGNPVFPPKQQDTDTEREIRELRDRIKVLERIATDSNSLDARETKRISAEIESLRSRQDD